VKREEVARKASDTTISMLRELFTFSPASTTTTKKIINKREEP